MSMCRRLFLVDVSYYVNFQFAFKRDQWIENGKQTLSWMVEYLLNNSYSNSKLKVTCKTANFEFRYIITHAEEKRPKFLPLHLLF